MQMTDIEILKSYEEAMDQQGQIDILAQLNDCPREQITDILKSQGVDGRSLRDQRGDKRPRTNGIKPYEQPKNGPVYTTKDMKVSLTEQTEKRLRRFCKSRKIDLAKFIGEAAERFLAEEEDRCLKALSKAELIAMIKGM